jgi:transcriptional regulator GlxA family with amidase domain
MPTEDKKNKTIAVVTYPGVALLDLVATKTVLDSLAMGTRYRSVTVGERTEPIASNTPMRIIPEKRFEEVPDPFAIIVPGGGANALKAMGDERLINYLRFAEHGAELVSSVSTGALILAAAGLLEGRQATTHPAYAELLRKLGVNYVQRGWVEDGKFICSAGVSAGIDMALQLAARLTDEQTSREVQYRLGYDPEPPFGGIDYDHIGGQLGIWRAGVSLAAPVIAAKPKRLARQGR